MCAQSNPIYSVKLYLEGQNRCKSQSTVLQYSLMFGGLGCKRITHQRSLTATEVRLAACRMAISHGVVIPTIVHVQDQVNAVAFQ